MGKKFNNNSKEKKTSVEVFFHFKQDIENHLLVRGKLIDSKKYQSIITFLNLNIDLFALYINNGLFRFIFP